MGASRTIAFAREIAGVIQAHDVTFVAGSVAHAAFLSLLPLLLLLLIITAASETNF